MIDHKIIKDIVKKNSKVLDLGCGDGRLLELLKEKKIKGIGIDNDYEQIKKGIKKKVSIIQYDIESGLKNYKDKSFDYVILNETLQVVKNTEKVLLESLRVGKNVIVGFPNFARWKIRTNFFFTGKLPKNPALPYEWYNTPNVRVVTVKDFVELCKKNNIKIKKEIHYIKQKEKVVNFLPNFFATNSIYLLVPK